MSQSNHDDQIDAINYTDPYFANKGVVNFQEKQVSFWNSHNDKISSEVIAAALKNKSLQLQALIQKNNNIGVELKLDEKSYANLFDSMKNIGISLGAIQTPISTDSPFAKALKTEISKVQKSKNDIKTLTQIAMDDCIESALIINRVPHSIQERVRKFYWGSEKYTADKQLVEHEVVTAVKNFGSFGHASDDVYRTIERSIAFCYGWVVSWDTEHDKEIPQLVEKTHEVHKDYDRLMEIGE